jgi:DNA-binding NarL/FixJ family response regulator
MIMPTKAAPKKQTNLTKVLIIDDHPVVREGLAMLIDRQPDLKVCGEASDVAEGLEQTAATKPDVAVVDIGLKNGDGLDLIRRLKARDRSLRILVWSMFGERVYAERALNVGALGYITKEQATDQIIDAIRYVREGKVYVSEAVKDRMLKRAVGGRVAGSSIDCLSNRELEVFRLVGNGLDTKEVAEAMHVSTKTVETYQARIKEKLKLKSGRELIQRAAQWLSGGGTKNIGRG